MEPIFRFLSIANVSPKRVNIHHKRTLHLRYFSWGKNFKPAITTTSTLLDLLLAAFVTTKIKRFAALILSTMRPLISSLRRSPSSKSFIFTVGPKIVADSRSANVRFPPPTVASGSLNSSATAHTTHSPNQPPQMALTSYNPGKAKGQSEAMEEFVEKAIYQCRFMAFFGVMGSLVGSILCFVKGCTFVVAAFVDYFANHGKVIVQLVEAIDVYLLGTVMLVFGMGLFELFVSNLDVPDSFSDDKFQNRSNFFGLFTLKERPKWLEIKSVNELKTKLGHVIVMLLLIGLFEKSKKAVILSPVDLLCFSASVLLSSACLYLLAKLHDSK
ncbi:unnamed protein product [Rhodiola kirilowii]